MVDDSLKEASEPVRDNPEVFDEEKERSRLIPIEPGITPEIQEKFERYASSELIPRWATDSRIYPDKLLVVYGTDDLVYRKYYWYPGQDSFYPHDRAEVQFNKKDGGYYPTLLTIHGEQPGGFSAEGIMIRFDDLRPEGKGLVDPPGGLRVDASISDRNLVLVYDKSGTLCHLAFLPEEHVSHTLALSKRPGAGASLIDLKDVLQMGEFALEREGVSHNVVYDRDTNVLRLIISEKGKFRDELKIPVKVTKTEIIDNLFFPPYFDNPFKVDPEEDKAWTSANLKTLGIDWSRTGEAQRLPKA